MSDRMELIARLGAAIPATADEVTRAVIREALAALVEDHGVIAAHQRRKAVDRKRKRSEDSTISEESKDSEDSMESSEIHGIRAPSSPPSPSLLPPEPPNNSSPTPSSPGMRTIALRPPGLSAAVSAVLEHFRGRHPRRKPGPKEAKLVEKALSWGYSPAELCEAIDGNADDPWHAERGKHDLGYVLRDTGHIDDARAKLAAVAPLEIRDGWFADAVGT